MERGTDLLENIKNNLDKLESAYDIQAHEWDDYKCRYVAATIEEDLYELDAAVKTLIKKYG